MSVLLLGMLVAPAGAARPDTNGEAWSFAVDDEVTWVDGPAGHVRVHYAEAGPSVTVLEDLDGNGVPDLPETLAATAEDVLEALAGLGFRAPLFEADVGLPDLGGSAGLDVYMVDFGGTGDGRFALDGCEEGRCAGHLLTDNDFAESHYADAGEASRVLASHELFHAVQAAYAADLPVWLSEGTATWAEHLYDPENADFLGFCRAYLREPTRSLHRPPSGAVTAWSYGTALFFAFLQERHGVEVGPALLEALEVSDEDDGLAAVEAVLTQQEDTWAQAWPTFAEWNLATGARAGALPEGYPFAADLFPPPVEVDAVGFLEDDNRFYPLAATYFALEHEGGLLSLAFVDDPTGLELRLHPVPGGGRFQPVASAVWEGTPRGVGLVELGSHPPGTLMLVGSYAARASESTKVQFCLGAPEEALACLEEEAVADTGSVAPESGDAGSPEPPPPDEEGTAAGCSAMGGAGGVAAGLLAALAAVRRRRLGSR